MNLLMYPHELVGYRYQLPAGTNTLWGLWRVSWAWCSLLIRTVHNLLSWGSFQPLRGRSWGTSAISHSSFWVALGNSVLSSLTLPLYLGFTTCFNFPQVMGLCTPSIQKLLLQVMSLQWGSQGSLVKGVSSIQRKILWCKDKAGFAATSNQKSIRTCGSSRLRKSSLFLSRLPPE